MQGWAWFLFEIQIILGPCGEINFGTVWRRVFFGQCGELIFGTVWRAYFWDGMERLILGQCGGDYFWDSVAEMLLTSVQCVSGLRENWNILEPTVVD